jgi:tetratricopeptide (TPR) repeat protein
MPIFTTQLLQALEGEAVLRREAGGGQLGDLAVVGLPAPLRQMREARLARLGGEAYRLLALAAVIGQDVPLALWAAVAGIDQEGLLEAVEAAIEARLLGEWPDGAGVHFAHALVRDVLYAGMLAARRREVHRRAATVLAAAPVPDPDAVASHFQRAGDPRAVVWLIRAGERARCSYAWLSAVARFEAALALLDATGTDDAARRGWLLLQLAALVRYADGGKARAYAVAAMATEGAMADVTFALLARYYSGLLACYMGDVTIGVALLEAVASTLTGLSPATVERLGERAVAIDLTIPLPVLMGTPVSWLANVGRLADARDHGEGLLAAGAARGHPATDFPDACSGLAASYAAFGLPDEAAALYVAAVAGHAALGHHFLVALMWQNALLRIWLPYRADQLVERRDLADRMDRAAAQAHAIVGDLHPGVLRAALLLLEGEWDQAESALRPDARGHPVPASLAQPLLAALAQKRGDRGIGWAMVRALLPGGPTTPPGTVMYADRAMMAQRAAVELALDAGDLVEARTWLEAHDRWLAWTGMIPGRSEGQTLWGWYHRAVGDPAAARACAAAAFAHATAPRQPLALLGAHRLLGTLHVVGDRAAAMGHLAAALALAGACAAPYEHALTLLSLAELHAEGGDRGEAVAALGEACALLEPLRARPALARAASLTDHPVLSPPSVAAGNA